MSISKERIKEIKNFKNKDFSDCPVLTKEQLSQMNPCHLVNRQLWKPQKQIISLRIDVDVLDSLKRKGKGWQTRVNAYLREGITKGQL